MLAPDVFDLLLRYFESIDEALASHVTPHWHEPALTSALCDLLDESQQRRYALAYPLIDLQRDLGAVDPLMSLKIELTTHHYPSAIEHWVTQADLGLIVRVRDDVAGWNYGSSHLLQAKRLYPDSAGRYGESSRFEGYDAAQETRIEELRKLLGHEAIHHLLYCPRGDALGEPAAARLRHLRRLAVAGEIFDYTPGLQKHRSFTSAAFDAGAWVASDLEQLTTLRDVHGTAMSTHLPLAWWLLALFNVDGTTLPMADTSLLGVPVESGGDNLFERLVAGDPDAIEQLGVLSDNDNRVFRVLPAHTLRIELRTADSNSTDDR